MKNIKVLTSCNERLTLKKDEVLKDELGTTGVI